MSEGTEVGRQAESWERKHRKVHEEIIREEVRELLSRAEDTVTLEGVLWLLVQFVVNQELSEYLGLLVRAPMFHQPGYGDMSNWNDWRRGS